MASCGHIVDAPGIDAGCTWIAMSAFSRAGADISVSA
jgi:hypothetical protein